MNRTKQSMDGLKIFGVAALGICLTPALVSAQTATHKAKTFAQKLVEETHAQHPEATEIGIATESARGCRTIASTDKGDIGERCEADDSAPMRTGKSFVEKEKDGYDVSLTLHNVSGKVVGSVGIEFKIEPGQTEASVTERAKKITGEMEKQITSKAALYRPAK